MRAKKIQIRRFFSFIFIFFSLAFILKSIFVALLLLLPCMCKPFFFHFVSDCVFGDLVFVYVHIEIVCGAFTVYALHLQVSNLVCMEISEQ